MRQTVLSNYISMNETVSKSPSYYAKKRFKKNKPAIFGLLFIIFCFLVAILGYVIMPDGTPDASDGAVQIGSRNPGFEVIMFKVKKNFKVPTASFFKKMFWGRESSYNITPVNRYWIKDEYVYTEEYRSRSTKGKIDSTYLVNAVKAIYIPKSTKLGESLKNNFIHNGNVVKYLDLNEKSCSTTLEELTLEFEKNNIEKRYYVLGTDKNGRDMLSRLIYGTRISLSIGFISVLISIFIGVLLGATAGFFKGMIDSFILWIMTVVWSIPSIMLVISISIALGSKSFWVVFIAVGLTTWVDVARVVRGQILSLREKEFVEAARALGFNNYRIILKHIIPNIVGPLIVIASANFATSILVEAGLSFLGLGVQPPTPSWGMMVHDGFDSIGTQHGWYLAFIPGICIMITVLAFNLFGNGLRDAFDPRMIDK